MLGVPTDTFCPLVLGISQHIAQQYPHISCLCLYLTETKTDSTETMIKLLKLIAQPTDTNHTYIECILLYNFDVLQHAFGVTFPFFRFVWWLQRFGHHIWVLTNALQNFSSPSFRIFRL
jgi:hypothetical protein